MEDYCHFLGNNLQWKYNFIQFASSSRYYRFNIVWFLIFLVHIVTTGLKRHIVIQNQLCILSRVFCLNIWSFDDNVGTIYFLLSKESRPHLRFSQSCTDWLPGATVQELKRSEHEANRTLAYSAGVENEWFYTFMPAYAFTCTNNLTFTFTKPRYLRWYVNVLKPSL